MPAILSNPGKHWKRVGTTVSPVIDGDNVSNGSGEILATDLRLDAALTDISSEFNLQNGDLDNLINTININFSSAIDGINNNQAAQITGLEAGLKTYIDSKYNEEVTHLDAGFGAEYFCYQPLRGALKKVICYLYYPASTGSNPDVTYTFPVPFINANFGITASNSNYTYWTTIDNEKVVFNGSALPSPPAYITLIFEGL